MSDDIRSLSSSSEDRHVLNAARCVGTPGCFFCGWFFKELKMHNFAAQRLSVAPYVQAGKRSVYTRYPCIMRLPESEMNRALKKHAGYSRHKRTPHIEVKDAMRGLL